MTDDATKIETLRKEYSAAIKNNELLREELAGAKRALSEGSRARGRLAHEVEQWRAFAQTLTGVDANDCGWLRAEMESQWRKRDDYAVLREKALLEIRDLFEGEADASMEPGDERYRPNKAMQAVQIIDAALEKRIPEIGTKEFSTHQPGSNSDRPGSIRREMGAVAPASECKEVIAARERLEPEGASAGNRASDARNGVTGRRDDHLLHAIGIRSEVGQWMIDHGYATGHGDTVADLLQHLVREVQERHLLSQGITQEDARKLLHLLGLMFDAYENGTDCYEGVDGEQGAYLGPAFRLNDDDFHHIADTLNRLDPKPIPAARTSQEGQS